jgi:sulfide:quinone oxidoreductase
MNRVIVLGGGFGGLAAANRLRKLLPEGDETILIDRQPEFMMGFRKTWTLAGIAPFQEGRRPLVLLEHKGIKVIQEVVTEIEPQARTVALVDQRLEADALIVALGAEPAAEAVTGLVENAFNVYDAQDIPRAADALREFNGGKLGIGIFGVPYKCPPAPYEMALLIDEFLKTHDRQVAIEVFSPQPMSLPVLGEVGCGVIEGKLAEKGITFLPNHKAIAIEPGEVVFTTGRRSYDLLFAVPPHRPPKVVRESALVGESGWIHVNPSNLETQFPGVYAVGDVVQIPMADGKPLPKAGVFAEAMGGVVAERIAAEFTGHASEAAFAGEGGCYLEVGGEQAMMVKGSFLNPQGPQVQLLEASPTYLEDKRTFERERLQAWF